MTTEATSQNEFFENPFVRRWRLILFLLLVGICAFTRLWELDRKAIMHDETLFTYYTYEELFKEWKYYYQPILHGTAMLYFQAAVYHIFGDSDYTLRLGCALLGFFSFFWIWKLRYWLGEAGTWFALGAYALAPGITFFQRFFHQDSMYLFISLWIVASFANWWRTSEPRWMASAILGWTLLFCNKESSLFLYFSIVTFFVLVLLHDLVSGFFDYLERTFADGMVAGMVGIAGDAMDLVETAERRLFDRSAISESGSRFPNPFWGVLTLGLFFVLCVTQIFEGITYEWSVQNALGHDFVLKNIQSIPIALGWTTLTPAQAPDASPAMVTSRFWILFYLGIFAAIYAASAALKVAVEGRLGRREFASAFWSRMYSGRWYVIGAIAMSMAIYLASFTTFFRHYIGFFDIYHRTWAYWGGQHEWGRISGPFHQHMVNILVYETPSLLIVFAVWIFSLFSIKWSRSHGFAFLLMIVAFGAFHKLLFSGLQALSATGGDFQPLSFNYFKSLFLVGAASGVAIMVLPRLGRVIGPLFAVFVTLFSCFHFSSSHWTSSLREPLYKHGEPVMMTNKHVNILEYMEIQFNFDGGWNLALVSLLIFFATIYTWVAIEKGERFKGFLVWWTVTATGAASYAREAVPQVGIHAMLPVVLLSAAYFDGIWRWTAGRRLRPLLIAFIALGAMWNLKSTMILNFRNPDDVRERMVYGQTHKDLKHHMHFVRDYAKIAPTRMGENRVPRFITDNNNPKVHKDLKIFVKATDWLGWPAKWYLRDLEYTEGGNPATAISEGWDFLFLEIEDIDRYADLKEKYVVLRGRSTLFWTPNLLSGGRIADSWKVWIPGHYLDPTPQAWEAFHAKAEWKTIWNYLWKREVFEGFERPYPSVSGREYLFCFRKGLF